MLFNNLELKTNPNNTFLISNSNLLAAARVQLAKNWKTTQIATEDACLYKVHHGMLMSKLAVISELRTRRSQVMIDRL